MYTNEVTNELKRLNFEDGLWVIFIILGALNIYGDQNDKAFLKTNNKRYETEANQTFEFTLIVTFFIYIYFFNRNYDSYLKSSSEEKDLFMVKVMGSAFLIAGIICLIYFQTKKTDFVGSPAI